MSFVLPMLMVAGCAASGPSATNSATATQRQFVLVPKWLPPGFSASGGGYVDPPGGLQLGNQAESEAMFGSGRSAERPVRVFFTLSYYGYHNPVANIRLTAAEDGIPGSGSVTSLGGRKVYMSSSIDTSGFVPIIDTSASWKEHRLYINASGQVITEQQMERFVANLVERPLPKGSG
jgi:hypothetical protein